MAGSVDPQDVAERDGVHHLVAGRGREDRVEVDAATGEDVIG